MDLHLKNLFGRFHEQFGAGPGLGPGSGTCLMKVYGASPPFIRSLYKAAAALYRTDPWKRFRPDHLFGVKVGKDLDWGNRKQPFSCVQLIGGDGGDLAVYMFRSQEDAKKMTGPRETIHVPNVEVLRVNYDLESLMFSSHKRMVKSLSLEASGGDRYPVFDVVQCAMSGELQFRNPSLEELKFVYAALRAVSLVHPLLKQDYDAVPKWSRFTFFEPLIETVDVQWPSEMMTVGNELVAVTVSHPPGQKYEDKNVSTASSTPATTPTTTPTKRSERSTEEASVNIASLRTSLRECIMCEKEVNDDLSYSCTCCAAVVYCTSFCREQHWNVIHRDQCGLYKAMMEREEELAMQIFAFNCSAEQPCKWLESLGLHHKGMWRRKCNCYSRFFHGLLPVRDGSLQESWGDMEEDEYPHDWPFVDSERDGFSGPILLCNWSEYYSLRALPFSSPVADILSHPLTVHYISTALYTSSKSLIMKGKEVIIHYLGPERELDWLPCFAEIGHLLNGMGSVNLMMIGPEVPNSLSGTSFELGSRLRITYVKGHYQEEVTYLPSPHLILALNCDLEIYSAWNGALDLIKFIGLPAFFSCDSEFSSLNAKQVLHDAGLIISYPVTPNPFRSPVRNWGPSTNFPSYSNGFVLGVNT